MSEFGKLFYPGKDWLSLRLAYFVDFGEFMVWAYAMLGDRQCNDMCAAWKEAAD